MTLEGSECLGRSQTYTDCQNVHTACIPKGHTQRNQLESEERIVHDKTSHLMCR
jgi:hypothetical protein